MREAIWGEYLRLMPRKHEQLLAHRTNSKHAKMAGSMESLYSAESHVNLLSFSFNSVGNVPGTVPETKQVDRKSVV